MNFNTEFMQLALMKVRLERLRQVQLGKDGRISNACEDPSTTWGDRIATLGEEFGEVCKELIEGRVWGSNMLEELIQVAAVAVACAEAVMRQEHDTPEKYLEHLASKRKARGNVEGESRIELTFQSDFPTATVATSRLTTNKATNRPGQVELGAQIANTGSGETREKFLGYDMDDYLSVLAEANEIYQSRKHQRPGVWRREGARGALFNMKVCMERVWWRYWNIDEQELQSLVASGKLDIDDFLDLCNYSVFAVALLRAGDRDGDWRYPE